MLVKVTSKYFSRLSTVAKFFLVSFTVYFFADFVKTLVIKVVVCRCQDDMQDPRIVNVLVQSTHSYIYLKYCYAIFILDQMQIAFRW